MNELPINQIVQGDCVEVIKTFPEESIDMVMFSPPYWGLRDYGVKGQIGIENHPNQYIAKMVGVCKELRRVLKKSGSMYIVLGDTYYGGGAHHSPKSMGKHATPKVLAKYKTTKELYGLKVIRANREAEKSEPWLKPKQKMMIPARVAIALQDDGWTLRNDIIWHKPNHMPSSVKDRLTSSYEHIFHFAKARKYYYNLDAIRVPHKTADELFTRKTKPFGKKGSPSYRNAPVNESYHGKFDGFAEESENFGSPRARTQRKTGKNNPHRMRKEKDKYIPLDPDRPNDLSHPKGKNPSDVVGAKFRIGDGYRQGMDFWSVNTKPFKGAHFAVYPEAICEKPIKSSCPQNGIVLDLMCGSGATLVKAKKLGRRYIGIELNPEYVEIAKKRLSVIPEKLDKFMVVANPLVVNGAEKEKP